METVLQTQLSTVLSQGREQLPERHEGAALLVEKRWWNSVPLMHHW